jgi:hypothetical protein
LEFDQGVEALESILALSNPVHRIKEVHARADALKRGSEAIDQAAAFREKWGMAFTELKTFATQVRAIEHFLPRGGAAARFLAEYETARSSARFVEEGVWKQIQSARASADLELQNLLSSWRTDARRIVESALERLPEDLKQQLLEAELAHGLAAPLKAFVATLDAETEPARVAALSVRAQRLVDELGAAIRQEVEKRAAKPSTGGSPPPPPRETRRLRFSDVATVRRIRTEVEWDALLKKLDERVRALLKQFEVELD